MRKELPKVYDPKEVEGRIYAQWEENKCFAGVRDAKKKPYTIVKGAGKKIHLSYI